MVIQGLSSLFRAAAIAVTVVGFLLAHQFVDPAPPRRITIAAGLKEGAYYNFGLEYAKLLAKDGVVLNVRETSGSLENLQLLSDPGSGVDIAFMQEPFDAGLKTDVFLTLCSEPQIGKNKLCHPLPFVRLSGGVREMVHNAHH